MEADNSKNNPKILMQLAKSGNTEAFGFLYELYFTPIFRYIYFRVKNKDDANDLTQTVFLKVFSALSNFQEQNKSPLAYFFTVSRNTVIDYWRNKKEILLDDPQNIFENIPDEADGPLEIFEKGEISIIIHQAIQELTEDQQEVIILKFINELSNKEISSLIGKTEDTIRQLQSRAIKSLHQILKNKKLI